MASTIAYEMKIGSRIRQFRQEQGLSMRELGRRTDLSVSFLSQVERGLVSVSISSLKRIADALDVSILFFLDDRIGNDPIIRAGERKKIAPPGYSDYIEVVASNLGEKVEVILGRMSPGSHYHSIPLKKPTDECIYMVGGSLRIEIDSQQYEVHPGDSVTFKGSSLSRFECISEEGAAWLWVITPPAF